jgi:hypothetical protein
MSEAMPKSPSAPPPKDRSTPMVVAAAAALLAFYLAVDALGAFWLDLGSTNFPTPRYVTFVAFWALFGSLAATLLAVALSRRLGTSSQIERLAAQCRALPEWRVLVWTCTAAFVIPLVLRLRVLQGAPLADDEGAYRFAAELLASGRLWVSSPEPRLFFDQNFMINDGRLYPVYFLGWPALLAMGTLIHAPAVVNPLLSALTVPALLRVLRHFVGPVWAVGGILLFLSAPFVQIAAATQLSHTSSLMALTWCLAMYLQTTRPDASMRAHAGFAFFLAVAFCIRPQSAVALALPLVVSWVFALRRVDWRLRVRTALAFLLPSAVLAALFLGALWAQNGSPWRVGYARYNRYIVENALRFTSFEPNDLTAIPGFDFTQLALGIARTAAGIFRLNFDLFGWPSSLAFIVLSLPLLSAGGRQLWAMVGSYLVLMLFQRDWGIDTFGPLHAFELSLPILVLTIVGARNLSERLTWTEAKGVPERWQWSVFPACLLAAFIACAGLAFVPVRLQAVGEIAGHLNQALRAPERAGLHRAVIFAPWPFAPSCGLTPRHFVLFRPVNDPDLQNDVLWVNHVDVESDRRLVESLPDRTGYVMQWTATCEVTLLPLATLKPGDVPPGRVRLH